MPKATVTLCALFLFSIHGFAQSYAASGRLVDSTGYGIPFASIALSAPADTATLQFVIAKENGSFTFDNISAGDYYIVVACVGYEVEYKPISVVADIENITIEMYHSSISMKEVMIRARRIPILMNGDTVVYNANSFKTQTNANVEDLIKKMPGIQVNKDGTVSVEGQGVTKILINGKEFFGGNVEAATKNLDASLVDKVEVIDKKSDDDEFTGEEGNQREKVINLVLKEDKAQGYFGTVRAGYGTDDYYDGHGNINFFKDATQLSIIGGLNNINNKLYGWSDMNTLNSFEITPFNNNQNTWWWGSGVKSYEGGGVNLHLEPAKGMKTDLAYVVTNEHNLSLSTTNSELYLTNNTLFSDANSKGNGDKLNHQINLKTEYEQDTLNRIVFRAQLSKELGQNFNGSLTTNMDSLKNLINSGVIKNTRDASNEKLITKIHWTKKNRKKTDNMLQTSLYYGVTSSSNKTSDFFNTAPGSLPFPTNEKDSLRTTLTSVENTIAATAAYQIQLNKKWMIKPGINGMVSEYRHDFDWLPTGQPTLSANSPQGSVRAQTMEYYVHISYKLDSFTTLYVIPEINQVLENRNFTTDKNHTFSFNQFYFIPYMFLRSDKPHKYNFHLNLSANLNRPDISQILPVTDNTNPYRTNIGNIKLQNSMNYNSSYRYQRMFGLGKTAFFNGWSSYSIDPVINSNTTSPENYSTSRVINFKNRVYSRQSAGFTWPLKAIKATVGMDVDYNFGQAFFIQNEEEILSRNHTIAAGPTLQFNEFDKWSFDADYSVNRQTGNIGGVSNNGFFYHEIDAEFVLTPIERLEWSTSLYLEIYGANNAVPAKTIPILNSEISFFIDKEQKWSIGAKAYDILDKNQNLWRWWSNNGFTQSQSNAIQRYVMGTLTYKITKPAPKKPAGDEPVDKRR
jgi:hypothetical protein